MCTYWKIIHLNLATERLRMRVLIVDDDLSLRELLSFQLKSRFGVTVTEAESAFEAIEVMKNHKSFDLIICDWDMPNGNGAVLQDHLVKTNSLSFFMFFTSEELIIENANHKTYLGVVHKKNLNQVFKKVLQITLKQPLRI